MKTRWGLIIFNANNIKTSDDWNDALFHTDPVYFRTVKDCFTYLGFKLPRVGYGYVGSKYIPGKNIHVEYVLQKYRF